MPSYVAVKAVPVRIWLLARLQSRLFAIRGEQSVAVILQKCMQVGLLRVQERTVQQGYVPQRELIVIEPVLGGS